MATSHRSEMAAAAPPSSSSETQINVTNPHHSLPSPCPSSASPSRQPPIGAPPLLVQASPSIPSGSLAESPPRLTPPRVLSFAELLRSRFADESPSLMLKLHKAVFENGFAIVPPDILDEGRRIWSKYLVGFFIDRRLPFDLVKSRLDKQWVLKKGFQLSSDKNLFYLRFEDDEDRKLVMESGPVFIAGRCFVVQPWTPEVESQRERVDAVPIWIKLCNLPKLLWSESGISFATSLVSEPLKMDEITAARTRVDYARVCILVRPNQQLPNRVNVNVGYETFFDVEYNWIPLSCSHCKRFGHSTEKCESIERQWLPKKRLAEAEHSDGVAGKKMAESTQPPVAWAGTNPSAPKVAFSRPVTGVNCDGSKSPRVAVESGIITHSNRFAALAGEGNAEEVEEGADQNPLASKPCETGSFGTPLVIGDGKVTVDSVLMVPGRVETGTTSFLQTIDSCLDICHNVVSSMEPDHGTLVDKGGTIDPSNPDTWTEEMRQADKQIALVMARMENPKLIKDQPKKVNLRVKLVKGHSGAPIRSSLRNKR